MKKRTLNQTWVLCLRMWRSIAKKWVEGTDVYTLKREWVNENGFLIPELGGDCFFCDCAEHCSDCPGKLVDSDFGCENPAYNYKFNPPAFYVELLRLNRIRKAKK